MRVSGSTSGTHCPTKTIVRVLPPWPRQVARPGLDGVAGKRGEFLLLMRGRWRADCFTVGTPQPAKTLGTDNILAFLSL